MSPVPLAALVQKRVLGRFMSETRDVPQIQDCGHKTEASPMKTKTGAGVLQKWEGKDLTPTRPIEPGPLYPLGWGGVGGHLTAESG